MSGSVLPREFGSGSMLAQQVATADVAIEVWLAAGLGCESFQWLLGAMSQPPLR